MDETLSLFLVSLVTGGRVRSVRPQETDRNVLIADKPN
jgi:hypothetical protein